MSKSILAALLMLYGMVAAADNSEAVDDDMGVGRSVGICLEQYDMDTDEDDTPNITIFEVTYKKLRADSSEDFEKKLYFNEVLFHTSLIKEIRNPEVLDDFLVFDEGITPDLKTKILQFAETVKGDGLSKIDGHPKSSYKIVRAFL